MFRLHWSGGSTMCYWNCVIVIAWMFHDFPHCNSRLVDSMFVWYQKQMIGFGQQTYLWSHNWTTLPWTITTQKLRICEKSTKKNAIITKNHHFGTYFGNHIGLHDLQSYIWHQNQLPWPWKHTNRHQNHKSTMSSKTYMRKWWFC